MDAIDFSSILISAIRALPVLLFAAFAGLFAERSGIIDISLEGKILVAAFLSATVAYVTQNPWLGLLAAMIGAALCALLHAWVSIHLRGNQLISGMAINIMMSGLTFVLAQYFFQLGGRTPSLDQGRFEPLYLPFAQALSPDSIFYWFYAKFLSGYTVLVYLALLLIPLLHWYIYRTRMGLRLRAVGENPHAADTAGVSVARVRYGALLIGGLLCGFSGSYLAVVQSGFFLRDMSAGNGFLALAALVFGAWRPIPTAIGCLLFALFSATQIQLEGLTLPLIGKIPVALIQMLPYIFTVIILSGFMAKAIAPKSIGVPFVKSR